MSKAGTARRQKPSTYCSSTQGRLGWGGRGVTVDLFKVYYGSGKEEEKFRLLFFAESLVSGGHFGAG